MKNKVSVLMATYNGEKYISRQIDSILSNLKSEDELIISDDGSTDNTLKIIKSKMITDKRIKLFKGPQKGIKFNFFNALEQANGDILFFSDQDDIWEYNKVETILNYFDSNKDTLLIVHNNIVIDENEKIICDSFFNFRKCKHGIFYNIMKNTYIGCCMSFRKELVAKVKPLPKNILMHDQWIGVISELYAKPLFINDKLIKYRRHGDNNSSFKHYPVHIMIKNRFNFILSFINYLIFKKGKI